MKNEIITNLDNPRQLEKLYRESKPAFRQAFNALYPELPHNPLADFWNERLNYAEAEVSWGKRSDWVFVLVACLLSGTLAKLPGWLLIAEDFFYSRNAGFVVFPALIFFFAWKNKIQGSGIALLGAGVVIAAVYVNLLPSDETTDTLILASLHLPLFLWFLLGAAFVGPGRGSHEGRLAFLKFNGELIVITTLILIAGGLLTAMTIALFSVIGFRIEEKYLEYIAPYGLAAAPIVGTYLAYTNPQLVDKISPMIARLFGPLVLLTLLVYLPAMLISGKNPYQDREFLLIFNLLLIGVMAIIFFSVAGTAGIRKGKAEILILFLLSLLTILVNSLALSAILFRITEWGITPNRLAVLGSNLLILANLLLVEIRLYRALRAQADVTEAGKAISAFLPLYLLWVIIVTFVFPAAFGFD
jgi:hypothetical protein